MDIPVFLVDQGDTPTWGEALGEGTTRSAFLNRQALKIFTDASHRTCKCGKDIDEYGDHCLGCVANAKSKASNGIRDGMIRVLQRILKTANMIDSPTQVECEIHNIVPSLPQLKPFDLSVRIDHSMCPSTWRTRFSRIGFDVTLIHSNKCSSSTATEAALYNESDLRLRDGEKTKFARARGGTNKITKRTLSADEVIGEILDSNNAFIPIAVGPHGELGSLFRRFLSGDTVIPIESFPDDKPNAKRAAERASSPLTPFDVLGKADRAWQRDGGSFNYGGTYLAATPSMWADQHIGLICQSNLANHIKAGFPKTIYGSKRISASKPGAVLNEISDDDSSWKFASQMDSDRANDDASLEDLSNTGEMEIDADFLQSPTHLHSTGAT